MSDTRAMTDFMKAIAILAVVVLHFLGQYGVEGVGAFQGFLAVFFFLSGYGLYHSFSRYERLDLSALAHFFAKRFIRLFPLFWISVALVLVLGLVLDVGGFFSGMAQQMLAAPLAQFLAVPFLHPTFFKWFVYFLVQCYLLSPVLFLLLEYDIRVYLIGLLGGIGALNLVLFDMGFVPVFEWAPVAASLGGGASYLYPFVYVFFGHIAVFGLGMATPRILERWSPDRSPLPWLGVSLFSLYFTAGPSMLFPGSHLVASVMFTFALSVTLALALQRNYSHPIIERMRPLGQHSYAIYLFHMFVIRGMVYLGIMRSFFVSLLVLVFLAAPFYITVVGIERVVGWLTPSMDR